MAGNGKTAPTRQEAIETGASFYIGRPCKYGHGNVRLTCNNTCYTCQRHRSDRWYENTKEERKEKSRERSKKYYLENRKEIKAKTRAYKEENREYYANYMKKYYEKNKEKLQKDSKEYYENNKDHLLELCRQYCLRNKDRVAEIKRRHIEKHRTRYRERSAARRLREKKATPRWASIDEIYDVYELAEFLTEESGEQYHVDHIVPIYGKNVCGLHVAINLRAITAFENMSKGNKLIEELL